MHHLKQQPDCLGIFLRLQPHNNISCYFQSTPYYYNTIISNRSYFTNTDEMKKSDPYAALGLSWGATATEIKEAFRNLARELHPDVSKLDPTEALNKFRVVKDAYDKLMNNKKAGTHRTDLWEEWSFAIWRSGDLIAQERTDVAGVSRKRPVKPAESLKRRWGVAALGHPDGRGYSLSGRDYLGSGEEKRRSATVGTGQSKWVSQKKDYQGWNPSDADATRFKGSNRLLLNKLAERSRDQNDEPDEVTREIHKHKT
jgi:curved DNA-binding protein CbpA